jgi:hypothetical protein
MLWWLAKLLVAAVARGQRVTETLLVSAPLLCLRGAIHSMSSAALWALPSCIRCRTLHCIC